MKSLLTAMAAQLLCACATQHPSVVTSANAEAAADGLDAFASEVDAEMTPEESAASNRQVETNAIAEMRGAAARCGTVLHFTKEPNFVDRSVFVDPAATAAQVACVQKGYPFVKASPK